LKASVPIYQNICKLKPSVSSRPIRELAAKGILTYLRWIAHWRGLGNHMNPGEELPQTPGKLDLLTYEFLHPRNLLFGTPGYVAEKIEELQTELNLQVWSNFPGVPHDKVMNSVKLFTEQVMPRFSNQPQAAGA
jgi:alkanesulfonate monooxygenase SsuD/methylene tetrahydromethanopterin reductase-like flavin-dependent oxidoreductase (luciferase family)